jgi:GT2 family glycosyltransferase
MRGAWSKFITSYTRSGKGPEMSSMSVAIVNHNTREQLLACLATVEPERPELVVVVDNASTDGSVESVRAKYPWVQVLPNSTNPGFGTAANQAIAGCPSPYVLLLNSDTRLQRGSLQVLTTYLETHPQAAIVGPRLTNLDGTLQVSCFPFETPLYLFLHESMIGSWLRHIPLLRERYLPTWAHDRARVVPWVMGAALAIRKTAFDAVAGFDESFFMYSEEVDLCYRLRKAGWQVHFAPVTDVTHVRYASTNQQPGAMRIWLYRSRMHFYRRHYSWWRLLLYKAVVIYVMLRDLARGSWRLRYLREKADRAVLQEDLAIQRRILSALLKEG